MCAKCGTLRTDAATLTSLISMRISGDETPLSYRKSDRILYHALQYESVTLGSGGRLNSHGERVNFIWSIADLLRDTFKRSKYQDIILPLTVLRRIDCVLAPTKQQVLARAADLRGRLENLDPQLQRTSGFAFYNTSQYDFERLLDDPPNIAANLRHYISGFSDNMREVLEKFDFDNTIAKLDEAGLLFLVTERFKNVDLHPETISNHDMGYIFEELIRKFNEALNENPGEHFTPREVIRLMVNLLLAPDQGPLADPYAARTVYDPCCGSGGMLTIAKDRILEINPRAHIFLYGQEINPETFALCKSDLYMKSADGHDAENIKFGSTLSRDQHADKHFDYLLTNPPYGKEWKLDQEAVRDEAERGYAGRFGAGLPRISDGQILFLQHLVAHMKPADQGGSRVAIIMNGSPLFTGDAGSGESEIRRWILENDWLEAIIALPEQLFYNTGIATYIWVLSNNKRPDRRHKVQLIDATSKWVQMRRSLGEKRREISSDQIDEITNLFTAFEETDQSKIFETTTFGFRKITVERPLRLNFQASPDRIDLLDQDSAFQNLAKSKKRNPSERAAEEKLGQQQQEAIRAILRSLPDSEFKSRHAFEKILDTAIRNADKVSGPLFGSDLPRIKIAAPLKRAILKALSEQDETAEICLDANGHPEADSQFRDYENVPLGVDINEYFAREVTPYVPDAWINTSVRDDNNGDIGRVGYEINFNRYFYTYEPPRPLEEIDADIKQLEQEILELLRVVAG